MRTFSSAEMPNNGFHVRNAGLAPDDGPFIVEAFDSTLAPLSAAGSEGQWGLQPFSEKDGFVEEILDSVEKSEQYRTTGTGDAVRVLIAETEVLISVLEQLPDGVRHRVDRADGRTFLFVGVAVVRMGWIPTYIKSQAHLEPLVQQNIENAVYIEVMVTDYRAGEYREGAGAALLQAVEEFGRGLGRNIVYVDGWAGNERRLILYYEQKGFKVVANFEVQRFNKPPWPGALLIKDI